MVSISNWTGTPAGNVEIGGLPLASANITNDFGSCFISNFVATLPAGNNGIVGFIGANTSFAILQNNGPTATTAVSASTVGTSLQFIGACLYHT
jgi:hypothetical protein